MLLFEFTFINDHVIITVARCKTTQHTPPFRTKKTLNGRIGSFDSE